MSLNDLLSRTSYQAMKRADEGNKLVPSIKGTPWTAEILVHWNRSFCWLNPLQVLVHGRRTVTMVETPGRDSVSVNGNATEGFSFLSHLT